MAIMIPGILSPDIKSKAEIHIFEWFKNSPQTDGWIILHSLGISTHQRVIHGETDFLVIAPGLGMFALEVKGGRVKRQLGKWMFINKYGEYNEKFRGPFDQAWEGIYSIRESIEGKIDEEHKHLKNVIFGIGVMFPDIEYSTVGVDEEPWQVFDINDGTDVRGFVERLAEGAVRKMKHLGYSLTSDMYPNESDVKYLADLLRGDFDRDVPLRIKQKYSEEGFLTLTREQATCVEQLKDNSRILIKGTAGTGKTVLAIEAVKSAVLRGERVAVFCFNRMLGEWISSIFESFPLDRRPMFAGTFHSYMKRLLVSKGINVSEPAEQAELNDFYSHKLPEIVFDRCSANPVLYDRIIIDEAQDLIKDEYLKVLDMSLKGGLERGRWTMFGDFSMQSIYSENMTENDYMDKIQGKSFFSMYRLTKNCRNTKKICIDIENIVGVPENAAFEDDINVPFVQHNTYVDDDDQKNKLLKTIEELIAENIPKQDIVILSPKRRGESIVGKLNGMEIRDYSVNATGNIRFCTLQAFKGLESSAVILTDIESYKDEKLAYVGLSRARFSLTVLETQNATKERNELFIKRRLSDG